MGSGDSTWYGRLDRQVIVDAGLRIAGRPGTTEVRFRALGEELEADPTAVYRHFRNKAQLMAAMIDRLMDDVRTALPVDADLRSLLDVMATAVFDTFVAHPAIGASLVDSRPVGPCELQLIEVTLAAFERAGFTPDVMVSRYAAFSGLLLSYVAAACRELVTAGPTGAAIEDVPWVPTEVEISPGTFPALSTYGAELLGMDFRSVYVAGVAVLIDSTVGAASR